jgi:excisionase family DNA binding protein
MSDAPSTGKYLTPGDVAERLRVSRSMVYGIVKRGELAATWVGRLPRITEGDLAAYLERARAAPPARGAGGR